MNRGSDCHLPNDPQPRYSNGITAKLFLKKLILVLITFNPLYSDGFPRYKYIDTISMGLPIVCFNGSQVEFSKL